MFEESLVRYCSPTLAGLKTASLFNFRFLSKESLFLSVESWNKLLCSKGVILKVMRIRRDQALIYVYRPSMLQRDWNSPKVRWCLSRHGYNGGDMEGSLEKLTEKVENLKDFPHEIGLFLGYPIGDVIGFIQNGGQNCKCCGCWKVYDDELSAKKQFAKFKKCTRVYCDCFSQGTSIMRLTVTAGT